MFKISSKLVFILVFLSVNAFADTQRLRLATTTSTENSGLLAVLHPIFEEKYDIKVDVIAVGTGKALKLGENGDVDIVMVHAPAAEQAFVEKGFGVERLPLMHNDFVILGANNDPAGLSSATSIKTAFNQLQNTESTFISRGDDSGTHKKEKSIWKKTNITPKGKWYLSVGQGMGAVIKIADDKQAYTLSDRGTYLAFKEKIELKIVFEGAEELLNPYNIILVNPERHQHVKVKAAKQYIDFIRGQEGQKIIRDFKIQGEALFIPDVIQ